MLIQLPITLTHSLTASPFLPQQKNIGLLVSIIWMQMLVWDFLDVEGFVAQFPEKLVCFGCPKLVAEQNDAVVGD